MRAALTLIGNLLRLAIVPLWLLRRSMLRPRSRFVHVRLAASPVELDGPTPLWQRWTRRNRPGLTSIDTLWRLVREVAADPAVEGLVVAIPHLAAGWATCTSVRDPIAWLRDQGKRVVAYLPLGGGQRELYVASAASRIVAPPNATLWLLGAAAQSMYLKPMLDRIGVSAEVFATGEYKTAAEALVREDMSEAQREQLSALSETIQRALEAALAERPSMDIERAKACFEGGFFSGKAAVEVGLLDACRYDDELGAELGELADKPKPQLQAGRYLAYRSMRLWKPLAQKPWVGMVAVHGAIVDAPARTPRLSGRRGPASYESISRALRAARHNPAVGAVILHIDSPGGSALASDLIHRELRRLREKKPVIACMGDVAASGGYYVAVACDKIIAQPTTTTGSIGVISARVLAADLLERIGLRANVVRSAPHADMFSPFRELTDDERGMLADHVRDFYQTFLDVVAQGRKSTKDAIHALARGRVWSGSDAHERGLVDVLGGLEKALSVALELAPQLARQPRSELRLRWIEPPSAKPPIEAPANAVNAVLAEHAELLELLNDQGAALYYASVPKLGS